MWVKLVCKRFLPFITVFIGSLSLDLWCHEPGGAPPSEEKVVIQLSADVDKWREHLHQIIAEPFILDQLTFESDVYMQPSEFYYLVDLKEGDQVDSSTLERALGYIRLKNKIESVAISIKDSERGKKVHMTLTGFWTLHSLKIKGILVGRDTYRRYYLIESGDIFDEQRHRDSIARIKESFWQDGYFNAQVEDVLAYDKQTKSVSTTLTLSKGERFVIESVRLKLQVSHSMKDDEINFICRGIKKQFLRPLLRRHYSRSSLNEETKGIKEYLSRHGFLHVTVMLDESVDHDNEKVSLTFTIRLQHKREFVFWGNHFFSNAQLLESIMVFERSVWLLPLSILTEEIVRAYHEKGFWSVVVDQKEEGDRAFFVITEGPRASIKEVKCEGIEQFPKKRLITKYFNQLLQASNFDTDVLKQALSKITSFYLKEGFWDIKIVRKDFELIDAENQQYRLVVTIDEGERRYFVDVLIPQFPWLRRRGPFKQVTRLANKIEKKTISPEDASTKKVPFDMSMLYAQKKWLERYCKTNGMTDISISYEFKHDGNDISVVWHIKPSHEGIKFGKMILLGSSNFPFDNIFRELQYQEGDEWDRQKLNRTLSRLKELEIFETVHAYPEREMYNDNFQPVIFKLHKEEPFEVRLRAGLGIEQVSKPITWSGMTYKAGGTFIIKNPLNCGDLFCLNGDVTRSMRSIVAQYQRPWIFGVPIGTVFQAYSSKYQQPGFFFCKKGLYEVSQQGGLIGLGRRYRWFDGNLTLGLEWMELDIQKEFKSVAAKVAEAIDFAPYLLNKNMPFFYFQPTLMIDCLDNKLNPLRGSLTLLSCKGMLPITERAEHAAFFKFLIEQSFFYSIMPVVLACRLRFGHIFYQTFNNINPIERFYLGGANSLRSYETDVAPPLGCFNDLTGKSWWAPMGGKTMVNANVELRIPVYGDIGVVVFQDLGALSHSGLKGIGKHGLLAGTGFGLRYNTPIGPLRFDIGWKWSTSKPFDRSYAWFLTFGNAF